MARKEPRWWWIKLGPVRLDGPTTALWIASLIACAVLNITEAGSVAAKVTIWLALVLGLVNAAFIQCEDDGGWQW